MINFLIGSGVVGVLWAAITMRDIQIGVRVAGGVLVGACIVGLDALGTGSAITGALCTTGLLASTKAATARIEHTLDR